MELLHFDDDMGIVKIYESEMMNMTVISIHTSSDHAITIKISKTNVKADGLTLIKNPVAKHFLLFISNIIFGVNKLFDGDIISIMVDSEFLHIDQLSSNLMYSCKT